MEKKQREINYEIVRILAMTMIIALHYLGKGGFLENPAGTLTLNGWIAWLIEAFCLVAVNVYVLISGYFGSGAEWNLKKICKLWLQIFFYSFLIGMILLLIGLGKGETISLSLICSFLFPIVTEHYWFATAYLLLFLFMPFLNAGMKKMTKKQIEMVLGVLLLYCCIAKTVLPVHLPWDKSGYDFLWFICLYLTGAYIRIYGIEQLDTIKNSAILYVGSCLLIFVIMLMIRIIVLKTGKFADWVSYTYAYNHLLCYTGSIGFFTLFGTMRMNTISEKVKKGIILLSGDTFGVYLLHEHLLLRYRWPALLGTEHYKTSLLFLIHMIFGIIIVFTAGVLVEELRKKLVQFCTSIVAARKR